MMAEKNDKPVPVSDDNSLNCSICLDPFKDPRVLPCCHTFCKDCLERTFQQQNKPPKQYPALTASKFKTSASPLSPLKKTYSSDEKSTALNTGAVLDLSLLQPVDTIPLPTTLDETAPTAEYTMPQEVPWESSFGQSSIKKDTMTFVIDESEEEEEEISPAVIRCPLCKASHTIPEGGIESFNPDYSMVQRIESVSLTKSLSKSNEKCESCNEEDKEMAGVCNECKIICKSCVALHEKLAVYNSHTVIPLSEYSPEKHIPRKKEQQCTAHNKEIVFYCNTCSQLICPDCVTKKHKIHDFVSLDEADSTLCATVRDMSESAQHTMTVFQRYREYIQGVEKELGKEGYTEELKKRINARFEEHIRELQARREAIIGQVEDNEVLAKKNLWAQRDHITNIIAKIETGMRFTERALKCSNMTERIKMSKQGKEVLSQVADAKWDHESIPPPLVYRCNEDVDILLSFGEVSPICSQDIKVQLEDECEMSIVKSKRKSKQIEIELGKPAIIKVEFLVPLIKAASLLVQILYGKRKQILDTNEVVVYKSEEENNTWNVGFVPRCAGTHIVQVWVGGIVVTNEEITVTGSPTVGSKVQPGPDWEGASTLTVGRVTVVNCNKTLRVDWSGNEEEMLDDDDDDGIKQDDEPVDIPLGGNVRQHKWGNSDEYEVELVL